MQAPQTPPAQPVLTLSAIPDSQSALTIVSPSLAWIVLPEILISTVFSVIGSYEVERRSYIVLNYPQFIIFFD